MAYSYTEKKRIRKDFGKQAKIIDVPALLAIQLDSYRQFLYGSNGVVKMAFRPAFSPLSSFSPPPPFLFSLS